MTTNYLGKRPGSGWHAAGIAAALLLAFAALLLAQPPARADSLPGAYSTRIMLTSTAHSATKRAYMRITTTAQEATARVAHASMTAYTRRSTSAAKRGRRLRLGHTRAPRAQRAAMRLKNKVAPRPDAAAAG